MSSDKLRIRKVHVQSLITILTELYEKGVDYVDIYGVEGDPADTVGLSFSKEYMNHNMADNFDDKGFMAKGMEEEEPKGDIKIDLSNNDDLNQLL